MSITVSNSTRSSRLFRLTGFTVAVGAAAVGAVAGMSGSAGANPIPAPSEYIAAADAATAQCDQEVVDTTLVITQIRAASGFNAGAVSQAGAQGPAQLVPAVFAVYGADDDGNGTASPFDVGDAVGALTRLNCADARELAARGHVVDPVSVIAAAQGGIDNVDHPTAQESARGIWAQQ